MIFVRLLDKAAIIEHRHNEVEKDNRWRLATVTQVEELKLVISMVPIWVASLPFGLCVAQTSTFFIKQGSIMNRRLVGSFEMPPASIFSFGALGMIISLTIYDKMLVPFLRRVTGNERGMSILQRMWIGMAFAVVGMITAAAVESKRLREVEEQRMSVFWLVPQFIILGLGDGFTLVGLQEYFYDQVPDNMRSLGIAFYLSVIGAANFLSSLLITLVDRLTDKGGDGGWIAKDLNGSRLDYFYWLLAAINGVNLCIFAYLASRYSYKRVQRKTGIANFSEGDNDQDSRFP